MEFRRTSGLWIPLIALLVTAGAARAGLNSGIVALLAVATAVPVLVWTLMALTGRVIVREGYLSVHGGPPFNGYNRTSSPVNLAALRACYAVAITRYGAEVQRAMFRNIAVLEDDHGGRQELPMLWWSRSDELRALVRRAVSEGGATCDERVGRWLDLAAADPTRARVVRRRVTHVRVFGRDVKH